MRNDDPQNIPHDNNAAKTDRSEDPHTGRPFRFFLNHSKAIAANSYLMLYPKPYMAHCILEQPEILRQIWCALNEIPVESLTTEGRVYGGGLHKLEPKEMANLPAAHIKKLLTIRPSRRDAITPAQCLLNSNVRPLYNSF